MTNEIPESGFAGDNRPSGPASLEHNMKIRDIPQSGRTGTMVSYKNRYGQVRRRYVIPRDPRTPVQVTRRRAMGRARALWGTLTENQYAAWKAAALGAHTRRRMNQSGALSAYLLFVKLNCNLAVVGQPMVFDRPAPARFGPNAVRQFTIANINGALGLKLSVVGKAAQHIIILGTKLRSAGVSYFESVRRQGKKGWTRTSEHPTSNLEWRRS